MKTSEMVYIGIRGSVVALNRATGTQVWATKLKGTDFVNVVVDGEIVIASTYGAIFCLDGLTGKLLWQNPLRGFGIGLSAIATAQNTEGGILPIVEKRRRDQQSAAAGAASAA